MSILKSKPVTDASSNTLQLAEKFNCTSGWYSSAGPD